MSHLWFNLPTQWKLNDVQAVLNVVISVLSTVGIFTFARYCWQRSTRHLAKQRDVPISSLFTVSSPGEAFSVLRFLLHRSFTESRYRQILYQSVVIIGFTVAAILSGPIANSASRRGQIVTQTAVKGYIPDNAWSNQILADVQWNLTIESLDAADFPLDQLLDFLPDVDIPWVYRADEWDNAWRATCEYVPETPLTLYATGNYSTGELFTEIPNLWEVIPESWVGNNETFWYWDQSSSTVGNGTVIKDGLLYYDWVREPWTDTYANFNTSQTSMTILMAVIHVKDAPAAPKDRYGNGNGTFGIGPVGAASYTRAICNLQRNASTADMNDVAFPNVLRGDDALTNALAAHYHAGLSRESTLKQPVHVPPGPELFRFYQAYIVSKDTQDQHPGTRALSIQTPTVQLSTVFLAVVLFVALLVLAALLYHCAFVYKHRSTINHMPESKLDWLLQSLREAERGANTGAGSSSASLRRRSAGSGRPSPQSTFDNAKYRHRLDEWAEDGSGKRVVGEVVVVATHRDSEVEMVGSPQVIQVVGDKTTLLDRPVKTGWHYCGGHAEECVER